MTTAILNTKTEKVENIFCQLKYFASSEYDKFKKEIFDAKKISLIFLIS